MGCTCFKECQNKKDKKDNTNNVVGENGKNSEVHKTNNNNTNTHKPNIHNKNDDNIEKSVESNKIKKENSNEKEINTNMHNKNQSNVEKTQANPEVNMLSLKNKTTTKKNETKYEAKNYIIGNSHQINSNTATIKTKSILIKLFTKGRTMKIN